VRALVVTSLDPTGVKRISTTQDPAGGERADTTKQAPTAAQMTIGAIERIWPAIRAFRYNLAVSRKCRKLPHVPPMVERPLDRRCARVAYRGRADAWHNPTLL